MFPQGHYTKSVTNSSSSVIELKEIKDRYRYNKDLHVFRTKCLAYGETSVQLEVGNSPSPTLPNPASTQASVRIICSKPETLIVRPKLKPTCPQHDFTFSLERNQEIDLQVQVLDSAGNSFYNFSTLYFDWTNKGGNGRFTEVHKVLEEVNGVKGYFSLTYSYQRIKGLTTELSKIRARISGYHSGYFSERFDVTREIEVKLVDRAIAKEVGGQVLTDGLTVLKLASYKVSWRFP